MPLVFAGILPNNPLLIDAFTTKEDEALQSLQRSIQPFEESLYLAKPDLCILLSSSAATIDDMCTLHASPSFESTLAHFGNFSKTIHWQGTPDTAARMLHESYEHRLPIKLDSAAVLDDESTIVLELVGTNLPHMRILPIGSGITDIGTNVAIGSLLKEFVSTTSKRVAVIAVGNLAATHTETSPYGTQPNSAGIDTRLRNILLQCDATALQSLSHAEMDRYHVQVFSPLLILSGMCQHMHMTYTEHSYAISRGVGYTIGTLNLS